MMEKQGDIAGNLEKRSGNGKKRTIMEIKSHLGNFYLAILISVLNRARGKAGCDINSDHLKDDGRTHVKPWGYQERVGGKISYQSAK